MAVKKSSNKADKEVVPERVLPKKKIASSKSVAKKTAVVKPKVPASRKSISPKPSASVGFPIVGMGASAGGLEALEVFFDAMPPKSGMAFILVTHLDPTHISLLPELLQKRTQMKVRPIEDGMIVAPDCVYVIPPNKSLTILNGTLQLMELTLPRSVSLPIDSFFRSLAQDQGSNAIGIILSGTGTDGTIGLKAIKGEVGMAMVQDEASAKYDGMPHSAISAGLADYTLSPDKMPQQLLSYAKHATRKTSSREIPLGDEMPDALQKIFVILRTRTNHDFSLYKKNTIHRRIERRMSVHQLDNIEDYVRYLQKSEHEADILFKDLLIGVTNFFRDPEAFEKLRNKILPRMLQNKPDDYTIRVWVTGCSSGEEAYSLAITLCECMDEMKHHCNVQIFGTDIDEEAINFARAALYPASILSDVGPERLKRHFVKEGDGQYRIKKSIREMLVFAPQNVIRDPPFTKLDILSCRNLLIYLGPELQKKLLSIFHYSLKQGGILFLGSSESIGQTSDLFSPLDKKHRIFRRTALTTKHRAVFGLPSSIIASSNVPIANDVPESVRKVEEASALQLVETILRQGDTPPCVIIDDACNLVYTHGRLGRYLEPAEGRVSTNILEMVRSDLKTELVSAIRKVATHKQTVFQKGVRVEHDNEYLFLDLTVKPILERGVVRGLMIITFQETNNPGKIEDSPKEESSRAKSGSKGKKVENLERDLQDMKENLEATIGELEISNEKLKSANEELQSTNEELQSMNEEMETSKEEMETSKEELQSLNEEAITVNTELQSRIDELSRVNDDMKNLLESTDIAVLFLDTDLCIRSFTPKVTSIIPLVKTDSGRPVDNLTNNLQGVSLADRASKVLDDLVVRETDVASKDGFYYRMRVRPYRTLNNIIDGVIITFQDITWLRNEVTANLRLLTTVMLDSNDAVMVQDIKGNILLWNSMAEKVYGYRKDEALRMNIRDIVPGEKRQEASELIKKVIHREKVDAFETQRLTREGSILDVWLMASALTDSKDNVIAVATTERNITKRE